MVYDPLSPSDRELLLRLARESIEHAVRGGEIPLPALDDLPPRLREPGASFVTITMRRNGDLRGCIGTLEARKPLAHDVCDHARAAALEDYRFRPVRPEEAAQLQIEISRLTNPVPLEYESPVDLLRKLRPNVDGVVLHDGQYRATFLPQVWEKLPDPAQFLGHLCQKMGAPADLWRRKKLQVETYQVEEFKEN